MKIPAIALALSASFGQPAMADKADTFVKNLKAYIYFARHDFSSHRYYKVDDVFVNGAYFVRFRDRTGGRSIDEIRDETHDKVLKLVCENGIKEQSTTLDIPIVLMILDHKDVPQFRETIQMSDCPQ